MNHNEFGITLIALVIVSSICIFVIGLICSAIQSVFPAYSGGFTDVFEEEEEFFPIQRKPTKSKKKHVEIEYDDISSLHIDPPVVKEYRLPDGSKVAVDTNKVPVMEKEVFDLRGEKITEPTQPSASFRGMGMAEVIRRRREEVF